LNTSMAAPDNAFNLILWRHAEAEFGTPDTQRKLTPKGMLQAQRTAQWLRKRLADNVRVISSPAIRTLQTAQTLSLPIEESHQLFTDATASDVLSAAGWPTQLGNHGDTIILVGHQPSLGRAAAFLLSGVEANWEFEKSALWWFTCQLQNETHVRHVSLRAAIDPTLFK